MQAIKPEILPEILIGEIDEFKGGWRAYQNLAPERLEALPQLSADILELARENGRITTGEILLATQANRATIRKRLEELVRSGLLQQNGVGKGTWYSLPLP